MKQSLIPIFALVLASAVVGCRAPREGVYAPVNTTKYNYEDSVRFVLMDPGAQRSVSTSAIQERTLPDGRLEVAANVRNRENRRIQVQAQCEFKDAQGFAIDSTPWQTLILTENAQETVRFAAMNKDRKSVV